MVPFPPTSVHGGWAPAVNNVSIFAQLPAPGQHRECNKNRRRFEGSTKAELRTFLAKKPTVAPGCIGISVRNHGLTVAADVADWGKGELWAGWDETAPPANAASRSASRLARARRGRAR